MAYQLDKSYIDNYNIKILRNDYGSDTINCYTLAGDYLYYVCVSNFKKREISTFNYIIGDDTWMCSSDKKQYYNKNSGLIFIEYYKSLTCFSTVDNSFTTLHEEDPRCWHFSYGMSDDGKIIYVLDNTNLHIINGITKQISFTSDAEFNESFTTESKLWNKIFQYNENLSNMAMTNSGKLIHFSIFNDKKFINIYDTKSSDTITSDEIKNFGDIIYSENNQKILIAHTEFYNNKKFIIYDMELNEINIIYAQLFSSNFYSIDYTNYTLDIYNIDCSLIHTFPLDELKNEWDAYVKSEKHDGYAYEYICKLHKLDNLLIISNVTYRLIYSLDNKTFGKYLGKLSMICRLSIKNELQLLDDGKHLIEFDPRGIFNYDITCLMHREQKITMLATSREFTNDKLFDRNLLPLIFDFLPKG